MATNNTLLLARFVAEAPVDTAARAAAADAMIDTLAVMIAGGREPGVLALASTLPAGKPGPGMVSSFWSEGAYRAEDAALLFGMASRVLDYDDVSMLAICHPSVPVITALLCATPWDELRGDRLCDAVAIGTEVMIRLGEMIGFRHYELGFHATATLGVFGATAAVAHLRGFSVEQTANAFAIAASLSSGLRINFGSMIKSLHVGIAAANALRAIAWSAGGVAATTTDVFSSDGFLGAFTGGTSASTTLSPFLGRPFVIASPGFERKRFPCCYMLHKIIAGSLALAREHDLSLDQLRDATVVMPIGGTRPLNHPSPTTGMQAMFSAPYAVLAAIHDRRIGFASFTDEAVARPEIRSRLSRIEVVEAGDRALTAREVEAAPVTLSLTLQDGRRLERRVDVTPGSAADPMSAAELAEKWQDCLMRAAPALAPGEAAGLLGGRRCLADASPVAPWLHAIARAIVTP
jgi:2-methylcitrate dehydratase PrpD